MRVLIDNGPATIPIGQGSIDMTHYVVDGTLTVEDSINVPTLLSFQLVNVDSAFVKPRRGAYVTVVSDIYASGSGYGSGKILATGFVTNEPARKFLGLSQHLGPFGYQQLSYDINVTSDEWLLNTKPVSYIPAFINQTDSQILAQIANVLHPGVFDTSLMASGTLIPFFQYDPAQSWSDIAKSFADANRYHYKVINRKIIYQPFGDQPLGIAYNDQTMLPSKIYPDQLTTGVLTVPPVNDCIVLGAIEPQANWDNYFVGDGFSSNFQLRHQVFQGTSANVLQDDWTEATFNTGSWQVNDPLGTLVLSNGGNAIGALNIVGLGTTSPYTPALNATYIQAQNGLELGGGINLQHGQLEINNSCDGLIGGVFGTTVFTPGNCLCGYSVSGTASIVTASGAGGIAIQPIYNGVLVGTPVISQPNHQYVLQTWIGAEAKNRYTRPYTNLTQSATFGAQNLASNGTITWVITDIDLGNYVILQQNPLFGLFPAAPPPVVTKFSVSGAMLPPFALYCLANSVSLNVSINYTDFSLPPQGYLTVQSLSGASGTQLPVYPNPPGPDTAVAPPGTPQSSILQAPIVYQLGFGMINQTAQISQSGEAYEVSFYTDDIPGVGSRIRFQSWAAGQSIARVQDPVAIASEASISGDDGIRSAIMTNLQPPPRTSDECEAAAGAAILDREYPQFQGTYTVEVDPYKFENLFSPSLYQYPWSGRYFYINAPMRGVSGQNFFVQTVRTQIVELKEEVLVFSIDYGPDTYLERLLPIFQEREQNLLAPTQTVPPPNPITLPEVLNAHLTTLDQAQVVSVVNALSGNYIIVDLGAPPVSACEVRYVDNGWGLPNQGRVGLFTSQVFTLPRTIRDQTWYLRTLNGGIFSRFSKALRVVYPLIPSPPAFKAFTNSDLVLDLNGDVRDIYGVELRLPGVSGQYVLNLSLGGGTAGGLVNPTAAGASQQINALQRLPITTDTQVYNTVAYIPQVVGVQQFQYQLGDIISVNSSVSSSINGLKVVTSTANTPGTIPTLVPNIYGNYVDSWLWPQDSGGGQFNNHGYSFPLNPNISYTGPYGSGIPPHFIGNSLLFNPVRMGQGVDPNTFMHQAVWSTAGTIASYVPFTNLNNLMRSNSTGSDYMMTTLFRLDIPAAGNYTFTINHDDGMFFGINGGASRVSGPNTVFHANTAVGSLPVLGGIDADGNYNDVYVLNFPSAGTYDWEIDFYQHIHGQQLNVQVNGQDLFPGYLETVTWFDVGQPFPLSIGTQQVPFTNTGTVSLQARNSFVQLSSGSIANGTATLQTASAHGFNVGDVLCIGARVTPLSAANGSQDASIFTGQWAITSVPASNQFSFTMPASLPQTLASVSLIGIASQLFVNVAGTPSATGNTTIVNVSGALVQRPVFAPSDLSFDLTDPTIKNVIDVAQLLNPSGFSVDAYFFNLTWDYSAPLHLTQLTVPVISGLMVDPLTQQANWQVTSGIPTGYRVQIQDPTTQVTYNLFTVDHPHNTQALTQFKMLPSDYYNVRQLTVTPFNALGPGAPIALLHTALSASGIPNTSASEIRSTVNGYVASGQIVLRADYAFDTFYSVDMVPSQAWIDIPPSSGPMVFSIQQFDVGINGGNIGVEIGCLTFNPGSHVGTYSVPAGGSFVPGEVIKVIATSTLGASGGAGISDGAGIAIDIVGTFGFPSAVPSTAPPPPLGSQVDILDWFLLGGKADPTGLRPSFHMTGTGTPRYSALDTDVAQASVASTHGINRFFLIKAGSGHPADLLRYDNSNPATDQIYQEITDNNDAPFQSQCVTAGFPDCFADPQAYKRHLTLMPRGPRFFTLGSTITTDTPGPNTFSRTADCDATGDTVNLGDVRCILSGPFTKSWGGDVGTAPSIKLQFFYGGTIASNNFNDEEVFWLVQNWGWVSWEHYQGGSLIQSSINSTKTAGGSPTLNFACTPGPTWW